MKKSNEIKIQLGEGKEYYFPGETIKGTINIVTNRVINK